MTENIPSRALQITDVRAAAALSHPLRRRLVLMLVAHERSVSEIAAIMKLDLKYLHYHIGVLQKLRLLRVARERKRAGRSVKVYTAVADSFFVPGRVMAAGPSVALHAELRNSLAKVREPCFSGIEYGVNENHEPRMRFIGNETFKFITATEMWYVLNLSRTEALRLTQDISARLKACLHRDRGTTQGYLVHFALAPRLRATKGGTRVSRRS